MSSDLSSADTGHNAPSTTKGPDPSSFDVEPSVTRVLATILLVLLIGGLALSWRQYRSDRRFLADEARTSVGAFAELTNRLIRGRQETLEAYADTNSVKSQDLLTMKVNFDRFVKRRGSGTLGWMDSTGYVRVSSDAPLDRPALDVSDRTYFRQAMATRLPAVSGGMAGRGSGRPVFVVAIPTFSGDDRQTVPDGVLFWASQLEDFSREVLRLIPDDKISVIDTGNHIVLATPERLMLETSPRFAVDYLREKGAGLLTNTTGVTGTKNRVVAFASVPSSGWMVVRDESRSRSLYPARKSLALTTGTLLLVAVSAVLLSLRTRQLLLGAASAVRREARGRERLRSLSENLTTAATSAEIAKVASHEGAAVVDALAAVVVGIQRIEPFTSAGPAADTLLGPAEGVDRSLVEATQRRISQEQSDKVAQADRQAEQRALHVRERTEDGRHIVSVPLSDSDRGLLGAMGFLWHESIAIDSTKIRNVETVAGLVANALERARLYESELLARRDADMLHQLTEALNRSEAPDEVTSTIENLAAGILGGTHGELVNATEDRSIELTADGSGHEYIPIPTESNPQLLLKMRPGVMDRRTSSPLTATVAIHRCAQALDRARQRELERAESDRAARLALLRSELTGTDSRRELGRAFGRSLSAIDCDGGLLAVRTGDTDALEVLHISGFSDHNDEARTNLLSSQSPIHTAVREGTPLFLDSVDALREHADSSAADFFGDFHGSWSVLPLVFGMDVIGVALFAFNEARRFDSFAVETLMDYADICATSLAKTKRIESEHEIAVTLQSSLLPLVPYEIGGVRLEGRYLPAAEHISVGGDWFDAVDLGDDTFLLIVGDIVGHGLRSAAAMGKLSISCRSLARLFPNPSDLLEQLDLVALEAPDTRFASMAAVHVNPRTQTITWSLAGHPPPVLIQEGLPPKLLEGGRGPVLGGLLRARTSVSLVLSGRSRLLLYTDGLVERRDSHPEDRITQLCELLAEDRGRDDELPDRIVSEMLANGQFDDVAVLYAVTSPVNTFNLSVPPVYSALQGAREDLRSWLTTLIPEHPLADDVVLAINEALTNSIEHGDNGTSPVHLRASVAENTLTVTIRDSGRWQPRLVPRSDFNRGRGLAIMRSVADRVEIEESTHGTLVTLSIDLKGKPWPVMN